MNQRRRLAVLTAKVWRTLIGDCDRCSGAGRCLCCRYLGRGAIGVPVDPMGWAAYWLARAIIQQGR